MSVARAEYSVQSPRHFLSLSEPSITIQTWQNGSRLEIKGRYLSTGTIPGSTWARMPMPYSNPHTKPQFDPPCDELPDAWKTETGVCSGR